MSIPPFRIAAGSQRWYDTQGPGGRRAVMTAREMLEQVLVELPDDRVGEVLDFARFLSARAEREPWAKSGWGQLARAYGDDEPDYTEADIKPGLNCP